MIMSVEGTDVVVRTADGIEMARETIPDSIDLSVPGAAFSIGFHYSGGSVRLEISPGSSVDPCHGCGHNHQWHRPDCLEADCECEGFVPIPERMPEAVHPLDPDVYGPEAVE